LNKIKFSKEENEAMISAVNNATPVFAIMILVRKLKAILSSEKK